MWVDIGNYYLSCPWDRFRRGQVEARSPTLATSPTNIIANIFTLPWVQDHYETSINPSAKGGIAEYLQKPFVA